MLHTLDRIYKITQRPHLRTVAAGALASGLLMMPHAASAQPCDELFAPPVGVPNDRARAAIEYDGHLIIGGRFTQIGGVPINRLARWNNGAWEEFGGANGEVVDLTIHNGDLIVSGYFSSIGGVSTSNVARWDGEQWSPFPASAPNPVTATVSAGNTLYGYQSEGFTVHQWDGGAWMPIGAIPVATNGLLDAVAFNGELFIAGNFSQVSGVPAAGVARWDGQNWQPVGGGISTSTGVRALQDYNGELHAGGLLNQSGGAPVSDVVRWDGTLWHSVGPDPFPGFVNTLGVYAGQLIAAGGDPNPGAAGGRVARWNGFTWDQLGENYTGLARDITQAGDLMVIVGSLPGVDVLFWRDCASACCVNGACVTLTEVDCAAVGGIYLGAGVHCEDANCEPPAPKCLADLNLDEVVNGADLAILLSIWGPCPPQ